MYSKVKNTIKYILKKDQADLVHLFNEREENIDNYTKSLYKTVDFVGDHLRAIKKPFSGVSADILQQEVDLVNIDKPLDTLEEALEEVKSIYTSHAIAFHLPTYIAHLNCPVLTPALAAEVLITSLNSSLDTWDQSAGGTLIERKLIQWTCDELGMGDNTDGIFTSGGTQSNLMGLLLARDNYAVHRLNHNIRKEGLPSDATRFRIFCSEKSHFSLKKNSSLLGLGEQAIVPVKTDGAFRMDIDALTWAIEKEVQNGNIPIAVVATAGTTDFGSIDPLNKIATICRELGLWFHVDAAYGCGLMLSSVHNILLYGIENADSVTVDYHKTFFQPVSSSALLVKDKNYFNLLKYHADYLNPAEHEKEGYPDQVNKSMQTTRRFDALKLWFTLRLTGKETLGKYIDSIMEIAHDAAMLVEEDPELELLNYPEISTILFRYKPNPFSSITANAANKYIRKKLFESGKAIVAGTKVNNEVYLKFTVLNPATTTEDLKFVIHQIKKYAHEYVLIN